MGIRFALKEMRKDASRGNDWTQEDLARRLNMSLGNIRRIEGNEIKSINLDTLDQLCTLLKCEPQDLLIRVSDEPQEEVPEPPLPETTTGKVQRKSKAKAKANV